MTETVETGAFCMMILRKRQALLRFMTAEVVYCHRQIKGFIEEVPFITELQKNFYKRYITARFEQILKPAYDMVMSEKQEPSEPKMTEVLFKEENDG